MVLNAPLERGEQRVRRPTLIYGCERDVTTLGPRPIRGESTPDTPGNGLPRGQTTRIYHRYPRYCRLVPTSTWGTGKTQNVACTVSLLGLAGTVTAATSRPPMLASLLC
jgi:hypothetical protein